MIPAKARLRSTISDRATHLPARGPLARRRTRENVIAAGAPCRLRHHHKGSTSNASNTQGLWNWRSERREKNPVNWLNA